MDLSWRQYLLYCVSVVGLPVGFVRTRVKCTRFRLLFVLIILFQFNTTEAQQSRYRPELDYAIHRAGKLWTTFNNDGIIGNVYGFPLPEINKSAPSFYYPQYSRTSYGNQIGFWIGGVVGNDTLVSTTVDELGLREFYPDYAPFGNMEIMSSILTSPYYDPRADAEEQFRTIYTDTFQYQQFVPSNSWDARGHKPLNVAVVQTSYAWSPAYAENFIVVDYNILNLSDDTIKSCYVGLYYNGMIWNRGEMPWPIADEWEGYIESTPYEFEELGDELVQIAYVVDRDGAVQQFSWDLIGSCRHAFGIAPLRVPRGSYRNNFNWWNDQFGDRFNWGPRMAETDLYPFRDFFGALGRPLSDRNKYYLMSKPEIDYGGMEAAVDHTRDGWLPPHRYGRWLAYGHSVNMVTSFGPFTLLPHDGDTLTVVLAIGENVHNNSAAYHEMFNYADPYEYADYLKFDGLVNTVRWARQVYDNPGIDTDNDGDSGKYFYLFDPIVQDTVRVFYEGDGIPDFRGATPPPAPNVRIHTEDGRIILRWNGLDTENYIDPMTLTKDFEGYRVYLARSRSEEEAVLLASYDEEDFKLLRWSETRKIFEGIGVPFTLDSLRSIFGEDFQPLEHNYSNPLAHGGYQFVFEKVDYNVSDQFDSRWIHKVYPDAVLDTSDRDEEGRMRYYEWEYVIENRLPTVPYYVAVTAFDFGQPAKSLAPMESSVERAMLEVYARDRGEDTRLDGQLNVYVYPNPYRMDDNYYVEGFENRLDETGPDKARNIFFANLPNQCTISVYSLDGDLIKRMEHDESANGGRPSIHRFDLVSRNREAIETGLYYWIVESEFGTQIGKLVILK